MFCLLMSELVNIVRNSCKEIQLGLRAQAMVDNFRDFDLEGRTRFLKWLSRLSCLVTSFQLILVLERSLLTTEPNFAALCTKRITSVSKCYTVAAQYIILLKTARWSDFVVFLTIHLQNMHILITKRKIRLFLQFWWLTELLRMRVARLLLISSFTVEVLFCLWIRFYNHDRSTYNIACAIFSCFALC